MAAAAIMLPQRSHRPTVPLSRPTLDPSSLAQFVDSLPIPRVLQSNELRPSPVNPAVKIPYYRLAMRQFENKVHQAMNPTRFWGFDSSFPGPTIESQRGKGILVRFEGFVGRYVWHCHILEQEDNEMMRPYEVVATK